ncbi:MAG: class I SAM-dependent methyltransferase [Candidatus Sulfotelmatobacter sp.]|jgi:ubiquinone/menaquinone biosynthesis C-methylase UbiE
MGKSELDRDLEVVDYEAGAEGYRDVASYDHRYTGAPNEYRQIVMANAYRGLMGTLKGKRILDVGCGSGRGIVAFTPEAEFTVGCDASVDMLGVTARKLVGGTRWALANAYAQQLPFASNVFDVVITLNFLHLFSLKTQRDMIVEMKRVTKAGGTLVIEFDNALHGLGLVGLFKRFFRDERGTLPWEARYVLGDDCRIVKVRSAVFPIVWRIFYHAPRIFLPLEKVSYLPPLNRILGHRIYYQVSK